MVIMDSDILILGADLAHQRQHVRQSHITMLSHQATDQVSTFTPTSTSDTARKLIAPLGCHRRDDLARVAVRFKAVTLVSQRPFDFCSILACCESSAGLEN